MAGIKVDVKGLNELIAKYEKRANALNAKAIVDLSTAILEKQTKALTPVDTGRLRNSEHSQSSGNAQAAEGTLSTNVEYAPYVEFGTSRQKAQPFLATGARLAKPKIDRMAIDEIRKAMDI